jgi:hypothetical protein
MASLFHRRLATAAHGQLVPQKAGHCCSWPACSTEGWPLLLMASLFHRRLATAAHGQLGPQKAGHCCSWPACSTEGWPLLLMASLLHRRLTTAAHGQLVPQKAGHCCSWPACSTEGWPLLLMASLFHRRLAIAVNTGYGRRLSLLSTRHPLRLRCLHWVSFRSSLNATSRRAADGCTHELVAYKVKTYCCGVWRPQRTNLSRRRRHR